jgi:6-phosphogluconolactonase
MTLRQHYNLYFAACTPDGGIYHYTFDNSSLEFVHKYELDRPMYLCADGGKLHVLLREPFPGSTDSGMFSYDISNDGTLSNPSELVSTNGRCACHLSASDGKIYAVNYLTGNVVSFGNSGVDNSIMHDGKGPHPTRQEAPHTHFVRKSPDDKYIFAVDLGVDKIYIYDKSLNEIGSASVPSGAGCRHLDYSPDGKYVYCANELDSSVTVFEYNDGRLDALETYKALPYDFSGTSTAAAIRISEDGKILYVSNRGHDSICAFDIENGGSALANPVWTKVAGISPRDFLIVDDTVFVTNEKTNNVTIFHVNGKQLTKLDTELSMPNPLCVIAVIS